MATPKAGIYTRLSRDRDGTQTATARQEADCRELAASEGWDVIAVYEDSDLSGSKRGVIRPDYERMLDDVRAGRIDRVLVWKLDRLSRQPGQFEAVIDACEQVATLRRRHHAPRMGLTREAALRDALRLDATHGGLLGAHVGVTDEPDVVGEADAGDTGAARGLAQFGVAG